MDNTKRAGKYIFVGIILTLTNFAIFTLLARLINNNALLWLDTIISYTFATFLGFILHSKFTWRERNPGQFGVIKFFLWNFLTALLISPFLTWLFSFITFFYEFIHTISENLHLPFDYNFIESTTIFCLVTMITMILNFLFYDKLVFGKIPPSKITNTIKNQNPKISVIIPIYNTEKYLKNCLDSILNQTYQNLEIILVDDGSTDNSKKIVDDYAKKDKRIKAIHQKNQGQSTARNNGLEIATGDFISFIDSDDAIAKNFYQKHLEAYGDNTSVSVCGAHYKKLKRETAEDVYIDPLRARKKQESKKAYILYLLAIDGRMYWSVNKLFRAEFAKKCQFDKSLNFGEDTKFVLDYLKKADGEISFVLEPLYIYNFGTETSTINKTATVWKNWARQYQDLKTWLGKNPTLREKFWLLAVYARWHVSYYRSKSRAKN